MDSNSEPEYAAHKNEVRDAQRLQPGADRAYFLEAMRFLEDACNSWRALAAHWTEAGNPEQAADALARVQQCELQRDRLLAAMDALKP